MKLAVCLLLTVFGIQQLHAQDDRYAVGYMNTVANQAVLFSGNEQLPLTLRLINHQYFKAEDFTSSRLSYGGVVYPEVLLRWDLYRDELIILSPNFYNIVLKSEFVDFAEIHGYRIIYLRPDGLPGCPPAGNYILLYSGNHLLLEKLTKGINKKETHTALRLDYYFIQSNTFYLHKGEIYYKIKNKRALLKALDTHRKELKYFIRANKFKYQLDAERMVLEVVKEHDKLNRI